MQYNQTLVRSLYCVGVHGVLHLRQNQKISLQNHYSAWTNQQIGLTQACGGGRSHLTLDSSFPFSL